MRHRQCGIVKTDVCIGLTVAVLGGLLALGLSGINFGAGYDRIGPRFFPYVVAVGLLALGGWFLAAGFLRNESAEQETTGIPVNWPPLIHLALALVLTLVLLEPAGFILACAAQFWLVARAFGSRRPFRDGVAGLVLSSVCFLAFSKGLGLTLPSGVLSFVG
ncbi:MAG: tripartite tricarboxylate transporter TctB family protein [Acidobacteria bacterium]|nr:tripartite tricarboxylate transporter TctB family protein [Acidobacteriota bacterium]